MEEKIIKLVGDSGEELQFVIEATLKVNDDEYAILAPLDNEDEAFVFRIVEVNGEETFVPVEDDEELDAVAEAYDELV